MDQILHSPLVLFYLATMGMEGRPVNMESSLTKHAYYDLSHVHPLVFVHLLRRWYGYGTLKSKVKFRILEHQVHFVLLNNSQIAPATFIASCLRSLPLFESRRCGIIQPILSGIRDFLQTRQLRSKDAREAKKDAAKLFFEFVGDNMEDEENVLCRILQIFDLDLMDIKKAMSRAKRSGSAKELVEGYIRHLIERQSYKHAVEILIHFSMWDTVTGDLLLVKMIEGKKFNLAEKWASFSGKKMLCLLVRGYADKKLLKPAYDVIKKHDLVEEFPELYRQGQESSLKNQAEKGLWEEAEETADGDEHLLEYLVYLAMEAGHTEMVESLCNRYSLNDFLNFTAPGPNYLPKYLHLDELSIDEVIFVDEVNNLRAATRHLKGCKVIGFDCEWKANSGKGSRKNKVSIMQIASKERAFVFDLIKLHRDIPSVLDECFSWILHSTSILKLGYNLRTDVNQLAYSYGELNCFQHFTRLLDLQHVFKEHRGGLSGLAEKILGAGLNKKRRNSDWEERPLTYSQLEYAALDAVVLLHIFRHGGTHNQPANGHANIEWKSHIISHMDAPQKSRKRH